MQFTPSILPLKWRGKQCFSNQTLFAHFDPAWLLDEHSLTEKLRKRCQHSFGVNMISQKRQRPWFEEAKKLGISVRQLVIVREVELLCDGEVVVIARSVIPDTAVRGKGQQLLSLNNRPLIDVLIQDRNLSRSTFELVHFKNKKDWQWGRRSIFFFYGQPLLVTEIFQTTPSTMLHVFCPMSCGRDSL